MWKKIIIHSTQIETSTGSAVLINLPKSGHYKGYKFWHPAKLVRKFGGKYSVSFTDEFEFKLIKNGNGKWNKFEVISEIKLSAADIEKAFSPKPKQTDDDDQDDEMDDEQE